jgi:hypothetical protein
MGARLAGGREDESREEEEAPRSQGTGPEPTFALKTSLGRKLGWTRGALPLRSVAGAEETWAGGGPEDLGRKKLEPRGADRDLGLGR